VRTQFDLASRDDASLAFETRRLATEPYLPIASAESPSMSTTRNPAELLKTSRTICNALHPDEWAEWYDARGLQPLRTSNMIVLLGGTGGVRPENERTATMLPSDRDRLEGAAR
jgi:hypothetical protein